MKRITNLKALVTATTQDILDLACKKAGFKPSKIKYFKIIKKSLDARDKSNVFYNVSVDISENNEAVKEKRYKRVNCDARVLVVGAGPAGLFCALELLRSGLKVTLIERGQSVDDRVKAVNGFLKNKILNEESNIQFGEGGAGAFSDGKLNTQVGGELAREVILDFVRFGAPSEIEYLNKPHIGSDKLKKVVKNIREEIIRLGGEVLFSTKLTDFTLKDGRVETVTFGGKVERFDEVVLAVGHSARDVYSLVLNKGVFIEPKDFAVGFRIEHLAKDINLAQYGEGYADLKCMPTADYKLTSNFNGRGVFTFCMCPGGYVMPSSSEKNTVVVNGMSNYSRDAVNSNSAVIVQVSKKDFGEGVLGGVSFQKSLEERAFALGGGDYSAPISLVGDYLNNRASSSPNRVIPSYEIGAKLVNLNGLLPKEVDGALHYAIVDMGKRLKGFDCYDGVLTAVESRTSSPVRITRTENLCSVSANNLYPCGEGCGYAGGITSAGADGKRVANKIIEKYLPG